MATDTGIERLLSQSGGSLEEMRELYPQLMSAIKKPATAFPTEPTFLTPSEAEQFGVTLEEGWMLKLTPAEEGYAWSLLSPDKWEITQDEQYISPTGETFSREQFEAGAIPQQPLTPEELEETYGYLGLPAGELQRMGKVPEMPTFEEMTAALEAAYPGQEVGEIIDYIIGSPAAFIEDLRIIGRTPETENLLKALIPGIQESELRRFFGQVSEAMADKLWELPLGSYSLRAQSHEDIMRFFAHGDYMVFKEAVLFESYQPGGLEWARELLLSVGHDQAEVERMLHRDTLSNILTGDWLPEPVEDYWRAIIAGSGEIVGSLSGLAHRIGAQSLGETLEIAGLGARLISYEMTPGEPYSAEWFGENLARMAPVMGLLIVIGFATGGVGSGAVLHAGGGPLLAKIVGAVTAGLTSTMAEGVLEAGAAYNEAINRGMTKEEAATVFNQVLRGNVALLSVTNTAQFATAFLPGGTSARFLTKALMFGFDVVSEGIEEGGQLMITRGALGDPQTWDTEMWQNISLGMAGGLGFGTVAQIYQRVKGDVYSQMTPDQRDSLSMTITEYETQGYSSTEAETMGWDWFASTTEGLELITTTMDTIMDEERQQALSHLDEMHNAMNEIDARVKQEGVPVIDSENVTSLVWERIDAGARREQTGAMSEIHGSNPDLILPVGGDAGLGVLDVGGLMDDSSPSALLTVPASEDILKGVLVPNWIRTTLKATARIPGIGKLQRKVYGWRHLIDPNSQLTEDIVARAAVVYGVVERMGQNASRFVVTSLRSIIDNPVKFFAFNDVGFSQKMAERLLPEYGIEAPYAGTLEHVFTHPEMYDWTKLDPALRYITQITRINEAVLAMLRAEGVPPKVVLDAWIHRVVTGKTVEGEVKEVRGAPGKTGKRVGAKPSYEKPRTFTNMIEGIAAGIEYDPNIEVSVGTYIEEAMKKIAGERFKGMVAEFGISPAELLEQRYPGVTERAEKSKVNLADAAQLHALVLRAKRGEKLTDQTMKAVEKRFPDLGRRLRALVFEKSDTARSVRQMMEGNERRIRQLQAELAEARQAPERKPTEPAKKAEPVARPEPVEVTDEQAMRDGFRVLDPEVRAGLRESGEDTLQSFEQMVGEEEGLLEGMLEDFENDRARPFIDIVAKTGEYKGEIMYLTVTQYRLLTGGKWITQTMERMGKKITKKVLSGGKTPNASIMTPDGKKVRWEYAMDEVAQELGYESDEALKQGIEAALHTKRRIDDLKAAVAHDNARLDSIKRMLSILENIEANPRFIEPGEPETTAMAEWGGLFGEGRIEEKGARYGFLQLNEAEYAEAVKSGRYPDPERYRQLTEYYTEPHEPGWRGISLAEMFPTHYKDLSARGVPDQLSSDQVQGIIEEKRIPYERGLEPEGEQAWTMSASAYLSKIGVHEPWIAEISPAQYAGMSKRAKAQYDKKRAAEWQASADAKAEWQRLILEAYHAGTITLETPGLHPDAKNAITGGLVKEREAATKQALAEATERNNITSVDDVKVGDTVWNLMLRRYGIVFKIFKRSVRLQFAEVLPGRKPTNEVTSNVGELQWQSYDDMKASVESAMAGVSAEAVPTVPEYAVLEKGDRARIISRYGDVPVGREGTVVKSWVDANTGNKYVTLDFGVNLTGQRLRNTYPTNVLEKVGAPEVAPEIATGKPYTATVYKGSKPGEPPVDAGLFGTGHYCTTNEPYAGTYGTIEVMVVTLENPFVINSMEEAEAFWNETTRPTRQEAIADGKTPKEADDLAAEVARGYLERQGYDGLIARDIIAPGDEIVVFYPEKALAKPEAAVPEAPAARDRKADSFEFARRWLAGYVLRGDTLEDLKAGKMGIGTPGADAHIGLSFQRKIKPDEVSVTLGGRRVGQGQEVVFKLQDIMQSIKNNPPADRNYSEIANAYTEEAKAAPAEVAPITPEAPAEQTFTGWHTPIIEGKEELAGIQSAGLPTGRFIALDKPFVSTAHDATKATEETITVKNVYDPDGLLGTPTPELHTEFTRNVNRELVEQFHPDVLVRQTRVAFNEFLRARGYDSYIRAIDGDRTNRELIYLGEPQVTPEAVPEVSQEVTLADIPTPSRQFLHKAAIENMAKGYREGNVDIMARVISVKRTESGFAIIEGEHRVAAAKEAGVEPPIVVLTEAQTEGLNAPEVDALAKKVYAQRILPGAIAPDYGLIPQAAPGMPEAGLQRDIFGYAVPFEPKGKGDVKQISLEDYNALIEHYKEAGLPMPHAQVKPKIEGIPELTEETQVRREKPPPPPPPPSKTDLNAEFDDLIREAKALMESRKAPYWQAKNERARKMDIVRAGEIDLGYLPMPFAGGKMYNQDFIDACNKFFGIDKGRPELSFTSDAAGILRITKASLDFSAMMIQGLPSFGLAHTMLLKHPTIGVKLMGGWYKALVLSTAAFFHPAVFYNYAKHNEGIGLQRISFGGSSKAIDYFEVLMRKAGLGKVGAWVLKHIPLDPFGRAEISFYSAGEIVRNEFWKVLSAKAIEQGKAFELARHLDLITGLAQAEAMGVPLTVRQLESSFMWFAPNYTRACLSLVGDIFRGGYTGAQARDALGGMMLALPVYYIGIQLAISALSGESEEEGWEKVEAGLGIRTDPITGEVTWRPKSDFLGLKIGNYTFAPGGFWYGLVRLSGNINDCIEETGNREHIDLVRILKHGRLNKDNPFVYWWFCRSSPLTGFGYELATHKDFLGYPIETPAEYAQYIATRFEPIWMEQGINWMIPGLQRDYEIPEDAARAAIIPFELFGWRSVPESFWVKFYDMANEYIGQLPRSELEQKQVAAWEDGKLGWGQLTRKQKQDLIERYPELAELYEMAQNDSKMRQSPEWEAYTERVETERAIYQDRINEYSRRLLDGEIDTREYRELCSEAGQNYGAIIESLGRDPTYATIFEYFEKKDAEGSKYEFRWDIALAEYETQIRFAEDPDIYLPNGDYNWDERDRRIDAFIEDWGLELYNEILDYVSTERGMKGLHPMWVRRGQDTEKLGRGYWRLPYQALMDMTQEDYDEGSIPAEHQALWRQYNALPDEDKEAFIEAHPEIEKDWRADYRRANPEADAMLALWGYGGKLQSMDAYNLAKQWGQELGIPLSQMGLGLPPETLIEDYFAYGTLTAEVSGNSAEAKLWRLENPEFTNWAMENWGWEGPGDYKGMEYYKLQIKWRPEQAEYDAIESTEARQEYLDANPGFRDDRSRMKAMEAEFPEPLIEDWVDWYSEKRSGYEDEWWLMEHEEFYDTMLEMGIWTEPRDFSKVPTREVARLYETYQGLPTGTPRLDFRAKHPDLDAWLVLKFGYKPIKDRGDTAAEKTPWEEFEEVERFKELFP